MSKAVSVLFLLSLITAFSQEVDACSFGWNEFEGRCYKYIATAMSWADAESHCVSLGANLVSIHNDKQYRYVKELITVYGVGGTDTWLGLSDQYKEGTWFWTDGSKVTYTKWATGQPDNTNWVGKGRENCAGTYYRSDGLWNDFICGDYLPFICITRACN